MKSNMPIRIEFQKLIYYVRQFNVLFNVQNNLNLHIYCSRFVLHLLLACSQHKKRVIITHFLSQLLLWLPVQDLNWLQAGCDVSVSSAANFFVCIMNMTTVSHPSRHLCSSATPASLPKIVWLVILLYVGPKLWNSLLFSIWTSQLHVSNWCWRISCCRNIFCSNISHCSSKLFMERITHTYTYTYILEERKNFSKSLSQSTVFFLIPYA